MPNMPEPKPTLELSYQEVLGDWTIEETRQLTEAEAVDLMVDYGMAEWDAERTATRLRDGSLPWYFVAAERGSWGFTWDREAGRYRADLAIG